MEFSIKSGNPEKQRTGCVVVGIFQTRKLSPAAEAIDRASGGHLSEILHYGDMDGKLGATLLLHKVPNMLCDRVLLVGLGKEREFHDKEYRDAIRAAIKALDDGASIDATIYLTELPVKRRDIAWKIEQGAIVAKEATYRFEQLKSKPDETKRQLRRLTLSVSRRAELAVGEAALQQGLAIAAGMTLAKNLGNLPGNICTPTYLAQQAQELAAAHQFKLEVLEQADMEALKMGSLLSVARGSRQPPKLIVLQYNGADAKQKPVVLVGKGITFDAGGISLKPPAEMDEMKYDMSGAGAVLGTFKAVAELKLPLNLVGIIPACENLPDGDANKPGDIVTSMSGQTIEVLNTDAEGRLILCDALTYAERFKPEVVVDIATLTGACVIALGHVATGLFANDQKLADEILAAGDDAWDRAWQLPLWEDYQEQLRSNFADMANIGGRPAGSVTAACYLARFTRKLRWAHLDVAGTAWRSGREKGSTGRPVPLLVRLALRSAARRS